MKFIYHKLSPEDYQLAVEAAAARKASGHNVVTGAEKDGTYTADEVELLGTMSEIATNRIYGTEPDLTVHERRSDGGPDIVYKGFTANIKATRIFDNPHLIVKKKDVWHDAYISTSVDLKTGLVRLNGYATLEYVKNYPFIERCNCNKNGEEEAKVIPLHELRQLKIALG